MPVVMLLLLPAAALVVASVATWRLERRLRAEADRLRGSGRRLALVRRAVSSLDRETETARRRHGDLANP